MNIAIFGGTFDPPHYGHLMIAEEVLHICDLDGVWFMPSPNPPHKTDQVISGADDRIEMVKTAIANNGKFHLSLFEFEREGLSFTYDTIKALTLQYPSDRFYFLIGADMVEYLPHWHRIDDLVRLVSFIGVGRPGFSLDSEYRALIREVEVPQFEISASFLRQRFKENGNTRYLLPDNVRKYIMKKGLYGQGNRARNCEKTVN